MLLRILLIATLLTALAAPAAATASPGHGDLEADVQAAHDYWQSDVCGRQWAITPDAPEHRDSRGGAATGLAFIYSPAGGTYTDERGHRWDWRIERCEFTVDPQYQGCQRRDIVRHEIGHFIHGPSHTGRMSPAALGAASFCAQPLSPHADPVAAPRTLRVRTRRTRAQIARSIRHRQRMARIRARAARR